MFTVYTNQVKKTSDIYRILAGIEWFDNIAEAACQDFKLAHANN